MMVRKNVSEHKLISLEGVGGVGKTTVIKLLVRRMNDEIVGRDNRRLGKNCVDVILQKLSAIADVESAKTILSGLYVGGTVRFEDIVMKYPTQNIMSSLGKNMNISYYTYLLTALYKDVAISALLPHVNVVADRYIYSIVAHHSAYGVNTDSINLENLDIVQPDLCFLLLVDEIERQRRLKKRGYRHERDGFVKTRGGVIEKMENVFRKHLSIRINTTNRVADEVADLVMRHMYGGD